MTKKKGFIREVRNLTTSIGITIPSDFAKLNNIEVGDIIYAEIKVEKKVDK